MTTSPWAGPTGAPASPPSFAPPVGGPPPPVAPPPSPPPRRRGRWGLVAGVAAIVLVAMAGTAAVTYAVTQNGKTQAPNTPASPTPTAQPPQYSAADQAAAKQSVCQLFDDATRGQQGQGGLVKNGELNVARMLRTLNGVMAVENALSPATPPDVTAAARKYIDASLKLTTASMANVSVDEGNRLNDNANAAIFAFADVCGLSH